MATGFRVCVPAACNAMTTLLLYFSMERHGKQQTNAPFATKVIQRKSPCILPAPVTADVCMKMGYLWFLSRVRVNSIPPSQKGPCPNLASKKQQKIVFLAPLVLDFRIALKSSL